MNQFRYAGFLQHTGQTLSKVAWKILCRYPFRQNSAHIRHLVLPFAYVQFVIEPSFLFKLIAAVRKQVRSKPLFRKQSPCKKWDYARNNQIPKTFPKSHVIDPPQTVPKGYFSKVPFLIALIFWVAYIIKDISIMPIQTPIKISEMVFGMLYQSKWSAIIE